MAERVSVPAEFLRDMIRVEGTAFCVADAGDAEEGPADRLDRLHLRDSTDRPAVMKRHKPSRAGKQRVKVERGPGRPMNAFMLWQLEHRSIVQTRNPNLSNNLVSSRLGELWRHLDEQERTPFKRKAKLVKKRHKTVWPEYKYHPAKAAKHPAGDPSDMMAGSACAGTNGVTNGKLAKGTSRPSRPERKLKPRTKPHVLGYPHSRRLQRRSRCKHRRGDHPVEVTVDAVCGTGLALLTLAEVGALVVSPTLSPRTSLPTIPLMPSIDSVRRHNRTPILPLPPLLPRPGAPAWPLRAQSACRSPAVL